MLSAFLLVAALADWVPARWPSNEVKSLELVAGTPVNCLLLEERLWSPDFNTAANKKGIATLGVLRSESNLKEASPRAAAAKLTGVVLEGNFEPAVLGPLRSALEDSRLTVVVLGPRTAVPLDTCPAVLGTHQGVWPGINPVEGGKAKAAPTGGPWIDTNAGFLRFAHTTCPGSALWTSNLPPPKTVIRPVRYLQAIADAGISGARWVVALDDDFNRRLLAGEATALRDWKRMTATLEYFEQHREWRSLRPAGQLAIVQDVESGALLSGSILDMVAARHTPLRPLAGRKLTDEAITGVEMAVNVDPSALSPEKIEVLRRFTRAGGTLLTAPPGWKFPPQRADQVTLDKEDIEKLDTIWREVNSMTGRRNLGARLFNVSGMMSNLLAAGGGRQVVLHLVNFTDYPAESVTAHFLGKFRKARLLAPGEEPKEPATYELEEGTGVDIDRISTLATLIVE